MKNVLALLLISLFITSCSNQTSDKVVKENTGDTTKIEYAYTIEHPDGWQWGSKENTKNVLLALKAFENGNVEESATYFGDTVTLQFDNFEEKVSKDSLIVLLKHEWAQMKTMKIKMEDFESVKSADGKQEYVSLWYKQVYEDKKGKIDSMECMDDMRIKNGKIILLNEKVRHYASKKM